MPVSIWTFRPPLFLQLTDKSGENQEEVRKQFAQVEYYLMEPQVEYEDLNITEVTQFVEANIGIFHKKRIKSLDNLKLNKVLKHKNPYLFKAKDTTTSEQIIHVECGSIS